MSAPSLMVRVLVVLLAGGELIEASPAGLSLAKPCKEKTCTLYEYCSDDECRECSHVCLETTHNYDPKVCELNCQDYIHEQLRHYIRGNEELNSTKDFQDTVDWLRLAVTSSLSVSCLAALGLLALVCYLCLRRNITSPFNKTEKNLKEKKISSVSAIFNNNTVEKEKELRLEMPTTGAPSVITTTTPISTRHPSEDATLEYVYDNPTLTPSPQLQQPRHETTF